MFCFSLACPAFYRMSAIVTDCFFCARPALSSVDAFPDHVAAEERRMAVVGAHTCSIFTPSSARTGCLETCTSRTARMPLILQSFPELSQDPEAFPAGHASSPITVRETCARFKVTSTHQTSEQMSIERSRDDTLFSFLANVFSCFSFFSLVRVLSLWPGAGSL